MFYPEEFKARVKAAYPNLPKLCEHMEQGERYMVRQFLEAGIERRKAGIPYEQMLKATSLEELKHYVELQQIGIERQTKGVPYEKVLQATSLEELQSYVKVQQERVELLELWKELNMKDLRSVVIRG